MAGYSFMPTQVGGFGGGYLSNGMGMSIGNAASAGLRLANAFREYQNHNMLDQFQIPAAEAGYDAARLQGANQALEGQYLNAVLQEAARTAAKPDVAPIGEEPRTLYSSATGDTNNSDPYGISYYGGDTTTYSPYIPSYYSYDPFQGTLIGDSHLRSMNYPAGVGYIQY